MWGLRVFNRVISAPFSLDLPMRKKRKALTNVSLVRRFGPCTPGGTTCVVYTSFLRTKVEDSPGHFGARVQTGTAWIYASLVHMSTE